MPADVQHVSGHSTASAGMPPNSLTICHALHVASIRGGRLDGYGNISLYTVWGPTGPPANLHPRARNRPPEAGNGVSRPSRTSPGSTQNRRTTNEIQKYPRTSSTYLSIQLQLKHATTLPVNLSCTTCRSYPRRTTGWL